MRIVIFGTGGVYSENKDKLSKNDEIIAFLDNDEKKWGNILDGVKIHNPSHVHSMQYDKIVLMSIYSSDMREQLLKMNIFESEIWTLKRYESEIMHGVVRLICHNNNSRHYKKRILVISTNLNYNGGTMAAVNAVKALEQRGYMAVLAAPSGSKKFINDMADQNINIVLCPSVYYPDPEDMQWIMQFDFVIVNVFQMISCASEVSKQKPVLWWLHEAGERYSDIYRNTKKEFHEYDNLAKIKKIYITAVSEVAKRNFEKYYPNRVDGILPYGVPDEYVFGENDEGEGLRFTFAIIGSICKLKAQNVLLKSIMHFNQKEMERIELWIIGEESSDKEYCKGIRMAAEKIPQVKMLGNLTRNEMKNIYKKIDAVVCASMEECLPTVIVEGMMYGKLCITTDATGIVDYIIDKENGFICKVGDENSLYETMKWIIENKDKRNLIKENARKTYEKYFTIGRFGERLEKLLLETEEKYVQYGKD